MTQLTKVEWDRLEYLLGKDHVVGINQAEMDEIISLLKKEYGHAEMKREEWIRLGLVSVGAQLLMRRIRLSAPPETFEHPEEVYKDIYESV